MLGRQALAGFFLGIGKTRVVMVANVIGMFVNIPLNYVLIFGRLGLLGLGIEGAAYGTVAGSAAIFLILLGSYLAHPLYREHRAERTWLFRPELLRRLLRFGAPAGIELLHSMALRSPQR
jgi:MATE family multidrug resistance protein